MHEPIDHPGLQLSERLHLQRRTWIARKFGWAALGLLLACGLLGLLGGSGPLAGASAANADGSLRVEHARFTRYLAPTELRVAIAPGQGALELSISDQYLDAWEMYGISPQPQGERKEGDFTVYTFARSSAAATEVSFFGRPHRWGRLHGEVRMPGAVPVAFSTWVHP